MSRRWFRRDQDAVVAALRQGQRPEAVTTTAHGALDDLVALHAQLGIFDALDAITVERQRQGLDDDLLLRSLSVLPFIERASLDHAAHVLFGEPAILMEIGWTPLDIRQGTNQRHRRKKGRSELSLPCHPDVLRDQLRRISQEAWLKAQNAGVASLYGRALVRGEVYAIDGTGLDSDTRVVALVCVSCQQPVIVAWRVLFGGASEKGREAEVTRTLIEEALSAGASIELLLADALYADGPLLAWLKYVKNIDALVRLPADRLLYKDVLGLVDGQLLRWRSYSYRHQYRGVMQQRTVEIAAVGQLDSWPSYVEAAAGHGHEQAKLWAALVRQVAPEPWQEAMGLVSTREWPSAVSGFVAYRSRWHIEDNVFHELKEGWELERYQWGRDVEAVVGRVTLTCLAFNTAQVYRTRSGEAAARQGIRRLRQLRSRALGPAPVVVYHGDAYAVLALEEFLELLGHAPRQSLLPDIQTRPPLGP